MNSSLLQVIHTGHSYRSHLIEVGARGVRRRGGKDWKNHFYHICFLARTVNAATVRARSFPLATGAHSDPVVSW